MISSKRNFLTRVIAIVACFCLTVFGNMISAQAGDKTGYSYVKGNEDKVAVELTYCKLPQVGTNVYKITEKITNNSGIVYNKLYTNLTFKSDSKKGSVRVLTREKDLKANEDYKLKNAVKELNGGLMVSKLYDNNNGYIDENKSMTIDTGTIEISDKEIVRSFIVVAPSETLLCADFVLRAEDGSQYRAVGRNANFQLLDYGYNNNNNSLKGWASWSFK